MTLLSAFGLAIWSAVRQLPAPVIVLVALSTAVLVLLVLKLISKFGPRPRLAPPHEGLVCEIDSIAVGQLEAASIVIIVASLRNRGPQSIAEKWTLKAIPPGLQPIEGHMEMFPADTLTLQVPDGQPRRYHRNDLLYTKALTPIANGGFTRGVLLFRMATVNDDSLLQDGTTFTLGFSDAFGNDYMAQRKIDFSKRASTFKHFPGLDEETSRSAAQIAADPTIQRIQFRSVHPFTHDIGTSRLYRVAVQSEVSVNGVSLVVSRINPDQQFSVTEIPLIQRHDREHYHPDHRWLERFDLNAGQPTYIDVIEKNRLEPYICVKHARGNDIDQRIPAAEYIFTLSLRGPISGEKQFRVGVDPDGSLTFSPV